MKIPKKFNRMSRDEQESWLVQRLLQVIKEEDGLRRMLAAVRGGERLEIHLEERPDELIMKDS